MAQVGDTILNVWHKARQANQSPRAWHDLVCIVGVGGVNEPLAGPPACGSIM